MSRTAAGRFAKGSSGNPSGVRKAKAAPGTNGVRVFSGQVQTGETSPLLTGSQRWVTFANTFSFPPVAVAALLRNALISGAKWTLTPHKAGGPDAERGMEIVQEGLLGATLMSGDTWPEIAAKAAMSWFYGASLHAWAFGRRKDGLVVFTDIAHRPLHTILNWIRSGDDKPFDAIEQQTPSGVRVTVPLDQCLYVVERMMSDDPFGVGVLRLVVDRVLRAGRYEALEGSEMFTNMGGTPIYRAPFEELARSVPAGSSSSEAASWIDSQVEGLRGAVEKRVKTPEAVQYLGLDSATYTGSDPNSISSIQKWGIEIIKGEVTGLADIRKTITDLELDIARVLGVEWVFIGGGGSSGTYGMHESKVGVFASTLQTTINRIAARATHQLARRLIAANGLDPDTATPTLVPEKITSAAVLDTVAVLEGLSRAGLHPDDPAIDIIRERAELPPAPTDMLAASLMSPRRPPPPADDPPPEADEPPEAVPADEASTDDPTTEATP